MMTRYALVLDGTVLDVVTLPDGPEGHVPASFDAVALDPEQPEPERGDRYADGTFGEPPPRPGAPDTPSRRLSPRQFRARFSAEEKGALTLAASRGLEQGDATLQVFLDELSAAQVVDLDDPELAQGLDVLVKAKLLTSTRRKDLLA